jgi:hypothetical protein
MTTRRPAPDLAAAQESAARPPARLSDRALGAFSEWQGTDGDAVANLSGAVMQAIGLSPRRYGLLPATGADAATQALVDAAVQSYKTRTRRQPHVIAAANSSAATLEHLYRLADARECALTVLHDPRAAPQVSADALARTLRHSTCLVTVPAADRDSGATNDLWALAAAVSTTCAANGWKLTPLHVDAGWLFGRWKYRPPDLAACSLDFRLMGGGDAGALLIEKSFARSYELRAEPSSPGGRALAGALAAVGELDRRSDEAGNAQVLRGLAMGALGVTRRGYPSTRQADAEDAADAQPGGTIFVWGATAEDSPPYALAVGVLRRPPWEAGQLQEQMRRRGVGVEMLTDKRASTLCLPSPVMVLRFEPGALGTGEAVRKYIEALVDCTRASPQ